MQLLLDNQSEGGFSIHNSGARGRRWHGAIPPKAGNKLSGFDASSRRESPDRIRGNVPIFCYRNNSPKTAENPCMRRNSGKNTLPTHKRSA